ncbi:armadillo-type protein [Mycena rosella]|uniref:Armadillo-type protein n=1 Tax=Mycena rosella TaxID=1033263 RepID=A0AAD7C6I7_MYCRO|nr:armadillo-type protein [Mycena rosella]
MQKAAVTVLIKLSEHSEFRPVIGNNIPQIVALLEDGNPDVQETASTALAKFRSSVSTITFDTGSLTWNAAELRPAIGHHIQAITDLFGRSATIASITLGRLSEQPELQPAMSIYIDRIIGYSNHPDPNVAAAALTALAKFSKQPDFHTVIRNHVLTIIHSLSNGYPSMRNTASITLTTLSQQPAYRALIEEHIPKIIDLLKDVYSDVRRTALTVMVNLSEQPEFRSAIENAIPTIVSLLKDDNPNVGSAASTALARFSEEAELRLAIGNVVPQITALLKDSIPSVQETVLTLLAKLSEQPEYRAAIGADVVPQMTVPRSRIATLTSLRPSAPSSVLRHRRPSPKERPSPPIEGASAQRPKTSASRPNVSNIATWLASILSASMSSAYIFMIAPPFVHNETAAWDPERLENRLNAFQGWVWGANAALLAGVAAILALSDVSSSPVPQSFVILGGIFALFGFFYTIFLAFHIGDSKTQFSRWFLDQTNHTSGSFWNLPTICQYRVLPVSLGFQTFIRDGRSLHHDSLNGQVTSANTPTQLADTTAPTTTSLNVFQLAGFALALVWSSFYLVKIHLEIRSIVGRKEE